ncbi:aspartate-semialdehyde dehydrogenase [Alphaproteobacteria bacterium]|nr:aspartate-semialdehyde dehydrogenase [Alphaproteobacteria bacterium]
MIVVGATGLVGREMLSILSNECVPQENVSVAASSKSEGMLLSAGRYRDMRVQALECVDFSKYDVALFSAGSGISKELAPKVVASGCVVIDNTSYFRMENCVPLIIPEVNFADIEKYSNKKLIANPNCSTIQLVMTLKPLHDAFGVTEVVCSTYQSVSGAGQNGVNELYAQIDAHFNEQPIAPAHFKKQIAFNVIPQIDDFSNSGYTKEELKMINETKKILGIDIDITATCVRVPVMIGHAVSVLAKFEKSVDIEHAHDVLEKFSGIKITERLNKNDYATPIDCAGSNDVFVSRLRKHTTLENSLSFWCVSDNIRKGAALNAIQIAKRLLK